MRVGTLERKFRPMYATLFDLRLLRGSADETLRRQCSLPVAAGPAARSVPIEPRRNFTRLISWAQIRRLTRSSRPACRAISKGSCLHGQLQLQTEQAYHVGHHGAFEARLQLLQDRRLKLVD